MKNNYTLKIVFVIPTIFFMIGCSASTSNRFKTTTVETTETSNSKEIAYAEDFDFSKYRVPFNLPESKNLTTNTNADIWFEFPDAPTTLSDGKKVIRTSEGFRVQVLSTDDLNEAEQMRSNIYFSTDQKDVYVVFDPPFYKVQLGDFLNSSDAEKLSFKMTQLGYSESRVTKETINIFK